MVSTIVNVHIGYDAGSPLDFTQTHRIYAERHGYEYRQITRNLISDALPTWSKHPAALAVIDDRDAVMIIDSDAQILETCPPFDKVVTDNHRYDLFLVLGHSFRPNAGLIMLRGGPSSVAGDFLRTLLAERLVPPRIMLGPAATTAMSSACCDARPSATSFSFWRRPGTTP